DLGLLRRQVRWLGANLDLGQMSARRFDARRGLADRRAELFLGVELGQHLSGRHGVPLLHQQASDDGWLPTEAAGGHAHDAVAGFDTAKRADRALLLLDAARAALWREHRGGRLLIAESSSADCSREGKEYGQARPATRSAADDGVVPPLGASDRVACAIAARRDHWRLPTHAGSVSAHHGNCRYRL